MTDPYLLIILIKIAVIIISNNNNNNNPAIQDIPCSHISHNTRSSPLIFCIRISVVSNFFWDDFNTQEKLKTNFGILMEMRKWWIACTVESKEVRYSPGTVYRCGVKTGNKLTSILFCNTAEKRVEKRIFSHPRSNLSCNKLGCWMRKVVAESRE